MKYMLLFKEPIEMFTQRNDPATAPGYWGAWSAYVDALVASGVMVSGEGLQGPETTTHVSIRDGKRIVQDGPYPETKEMLGGFFVIDVPNLDAAIEWAARSPGASYGSTEVRPVLNPTQSPD